MFGTVFVYTSKSLVDDSDKNVSCRTWMEWTRRLTFRRKELLRNLCRQFWRNKIKVKTGGVVTTIPRGVTAAGLVGAIMGLISARHIPEPASWLGVLLHDEHLTTRAAQIYSRHQLISVLTEWMNKCTESVVLLQEWIIWMHDDSAVKYNQNSVYGVCTSILYWAKEILLDFIKS